MHVMLDLDGTTTGPVTLDLEPLDLPARPGVLLDGHARHHAGGDTGVVFVPAHPYPPENKARSLATAGDARVLVVCPRLVSPARTFLALAIARLIAQQRTIDEAAHAPVITCGARPHCTWEAGAITVPHLVSVVTPDAIQLRVVWELTDHRRTAAWRDRPDPADLEPLAVAA
ncbi:hypothetical protein [Pseudofrankia sp. DC12]|uniref:hypothetical protein n=1 Tax=Pseudofrankia sp. DC12 TaxID=683315 RepID=UPI0005F8878B|nr:hypothetical protein [Pseudofrankia sp. DC12]